MKVTQIKNNEAEFAARKKRDLQEIEQIEKSSRQQFSAAANVDISQKLKDAVNKISEKLDYLNNQSSFSSDKKAISSARYDDQKLDLIDKLKEKINNSKDEIKEIKETNKTEQKKELEQENKPGFFKKVGEKIGAFFNKVKSYIKKIMGISTATTETESTAANLQEPKQQQQQQDKQQTQQHDKDIKLMHSLEHDIQDFYKVANEVATKIKAENNTEKMTNFTTLIDEKTADFKAQAAIFETEKGDNLSDKIETMHQDFQTEHVTAKEQEAAPQQQQKQQEMELS